MHEDGAFCANAVEATITEHTSSCTGHVGSPSLASFRMSRALPLERHGIVSWPDIILLLRPPALVQHRFGRLGLHEICGFGFELASPLSSHIPEFGRCGAQKRALHFSKKGSVHPVAL